MQEVLKKKSRRMMDWRVRLPSLARYGALVVFILGIIFIASSYYFRRNIKPFRMVSQETQLSTQVTGIIEGIERREMKNDRLWLLLRAARDVSYSDGHHELEDVHLEVYPATGDVPDKISAKRSIVDGTNNRFSFLGDVNFETHDGLAVETQSIVYDRERDIAETNDVVNFKRENIVGKSRGAVVNTKDKQLELRSDVEVTVTPENAGGAATQKQNSALPMSKQRNKPVTIKSARLNFDQIKMLLTFSGGASAQQDEDVFSGEVLTAILNEHKHVRQIQARKDSYLRTMTEGRAAEVSSAEMDFFFDAGQQLERAVARQNVHARSLNADSELQLTAGNVNVSFTSQTDKHESVLREMQTDGRSVATLSAPRSHANDPRAANKRLTADSIELTWRATGRDLESAAVVGNAELLIEPVQPSPAADRKTLTAPRFDCEFYETGNLARLFTASGGSVKAVIEAVQPNDKRATRTMTAEKMIAAFNQTTQDVDRVDAQGDAKFNQGDRNGQAESATYTASDETVKLKGGEPVVWDSRARLKGNEIDSDLKAGISYVRGRASTTYYSQEKTNGATPFSQVKSPVFISSERAEFQHQSGTAIYTGNARAWQNDNFVKADRLTLRSESKSMTGEGHVESALYQMRRKQADGSRAVIPVFATGDRMSYSDVERLLRFNGNADIRQGTDRITSNVAEVYLLKEANEVEKTIAEQNVVVMQPGRRGTGDWGQYTAADESLVLKGEPARVEDAAQGTTESRRLTVLMRESKVVSDDSTENQQSTGRVHSTHRVRKL